MESDARDILWEVLDSRVGFSDHRPFLEHVCRTIVRTLPCDTATLYVWSSRFDGFVPRVDIGVPAHVAERFRTRRYDRDYFASFRPEAEGRVLVADAASEHPAAHALLADSELGAMAIVLLAHQDRYEGGIACGLRDATHFTPAQIATLAQAAPALARLIHSGRVEGRAARIAERRTWLAQWSAKVLAATELMDVAELLAGASRDLFGISGAWLMFLEDDILVGYRRTPEGTRMPVVRIPMTATSASVDAVRRGAVVVVNEYAKSHYASLAAAQQFKPAAAMAVPLVDDQGVVGVLMVNDLEDPFSFSTMDQEDAVILGTIATAAVRKLSLVRALMDASAAKSDFLASVSHELRTPLNIIVGYGQLLRDGTFGDVNPDQIDTLDRMLRTASEQIALINDLLDLARIEQGKLRCDPSVVSIASLAPWLDDMMTALLRDRPVRFETAIAADAVALADPERLRQILVNVLGNAAKFTLEGCIRLVAECTDDTVAIAVEDTGPGIDPALAQRMLEPFVRGEGAGAGSGLGLAIVTRLLHLLRGQIHIDSTLGSGTRVTVRLPRATAT